MKRGHLIAGIACLAVLVLTAQGAEAVSVERSVFHAGNSTYRVVLSISGETVSGITESLTPDMTVGDVSLPPEQFQVNGQALSLALISEREVTYMVKASRYPAGNISGTWVDLLSGEQGIVSEGDDGVPGRVDPPTTPAATGTPRAGLSFFSLMAALSLATVISTAFRPAGGDNP